MSVCSAIDTRVKQWRQKKRNKYKARDNPQEPTANNQPCRTVIHSEATQPVSKDEQWKAEERDFRGRQLCIAKWLNAITLFAGIVGIFGLFILYGTLKTTQRQVDLAHRPWVKPIISISKSKPIIIGDDGSVTFAVEIGLRNVGNMPALHVATHLFLATQDYRPGHAKIWQREFCTPFRSLPFERFLYPTLFPGETTTQEEVLTLDPREGKAALSRNEMSPIIIGCVDYGYEFSDRHHQTGIIVHTSIEGIQVACPMLVPKENLVLMDWMGAEAD